MEAVILLHTGGPGAPLGPGGPCGPCISDFISTVPDDRTSLFSLLVSDVGEEVMSLFSFAPCIKSDKNLLFYWGTLCDS